MAQTLETWPRAVSGNTRYPWDSWADGKVWKITMNTDFVCGLDTMVNNLHRTARRLGLGVRTHLVRTEDAVIFQFFDQEPA